MTSVFFTTILTCSMTGLVVISSGLLDKTDLSGSVLVTKAYNAGLPFNIGMYLVAVGIIFFSFTTILGWNYYGERCVLYLTGKTGSIKIFKIVYILAICSSAVPDTGTNLADGRYHQCTDDHSEPNRITWTSKSGYQ